MSDNTPPLCLPPLFGGGLVLGYRCPARCRHCLYGCGPHRRDGEADDPEVIEALLDQLARRAPQARYHIGGGEPFLDRQRLARVIEGMRRRDLTLDYVETNASWVRDAEHAGDTLGELAAVGLRCVLISLSPFHAEFVPYARTQALIEAANQVLSAGALVWISDFHDEVRQAAGDQCLDLDALLAERGERYARDLARRYGLVPSGRAGRFLHVHQQRRAWRDLTRDNTCRQRLRDTSHFHVDLEGRYVPGLCAGLALPIEEVPGAIDPQRYPLVTGLAHRGPAAVVEIAREHGFEPSATYSSACDLCSHARSHLADRGAAYAELGPPGYYDRRSVAGW